MLFKTSFWGWLCSGMWTQVHRENWTSATRAWVVPVPTSRLAVVLYTNCKMSSHSDPKMSEFPSTRNMMSVGWEKAQNGEMPNTEIVRLKHTDALNTKCSAFNGQNHYFFSGRHWCVVQNEQANNPSVKLSIKKKVCVTCHVSLCCGDFPHFRNKQKRLGKKSYPNSVFVKP